MTISNSKFGGNTSAISNTYQINSEQCLTVDAGSGSAKMISAATTGELTPT